MTSESFNTAFEDAEEYVAEPPRPLVREMPLPEPFPVDCIGPLLGDAAKAIHDLTQAPMAIGAQSVLAASALAGQGHADIQLPTGQVKPISNFFLTLAASGERKSTCDGYALDPMRRREKALRERYDEDLFAYLNDKEAWEKQRAQLLGNKKLCPDRAAKVQALRDLARIIHGAP